MLTYPQRAILARGILLISFTPEEMQLKQHYLSTEGVYDSRLHEKMLVDELVGDNQDRVLYCVERQEILFLRQNFIYNLFQFDAEDFHSVMGTLVDLMLEDTSPGA